MELLQANKKKRLPYQGLKLKVMLTTFCSRLIKQVALHDYKNKKSNEREREREWIYGSLEPRGNVENETGIHHAIRGTVQVMLSEDIYYT